MFWGSCTGICELILSSSKSNGCSFFSIGLLVFILLLAFCSLTLFTLLVLFLKLFIGINNNKGQTIYTKKQLNRVNSASKILSRSSSELAFHKSQGISYNNHNNKIK